MTATTNTRTLRLFFALWPDTAQRRALTHASAQAVRHCGGRPVPVANLHLTLAFLGSVAAPRVPELVRCAAALAAPPLSLRFERLEHWVREQILCAVCTEALAAQRLAGALRELAVAAGFAPDLKPFRAHVTLARKVVKPPLQTMCPLVWGCDSFALLESRTESAGPVYSVIESYPLDAEKPHE